MSVKSTASACNGWLWVPDPQLVRRSAFPHGAMVLAAPVPVDRRTAAVVVTAAGLAVVAVVDGAAVDGAAVDGAAVAVADAVGPGPGVSAAAVALTLPLPWQPVSEAQATASRTALGSNVRTTGTAGPFSECDGNRHRRTGAPDRDTQPAGRQLQGPCHKPYCTTVAGI